MTNSFRQTFELQKRSGTRSTIFSTGSLEGMSDWRLFTNMFGIGLGGFETIFLFSKLLSRKTFGSLWNATKGSPDSTSFLFTSWRTQTIFGKVKTLTPIR